MSMDDWGTLRTNRYAPQETWDTFLRWVNAPTPSKAKRRELEGDFLLQSMPMLGSVLRSKFGDIQDADCDDICSCVSMKLLAKVFRNQDRFLATGGPDAFASLLNVASRNLIYDYLRSNRRDNREFAAELCYSRPQLSIPKAVELQSILDDLPQDITTFALKRDRMQFGNRAILAVSKLMVVGKDVPEDMLRNWLGVENPERCVAFVTLMARWYLFKYRSKFSPVLDGELAEKVAMIDSRCHLV